MDPSIIVEFVDNNPDLPPAIKGVLLAVAADWYQALGGDSDPLGQLVDIVLAHNLDLVIGEDMTPQQFVDDIRKGLNNV